MKVIMQIFMDIDQDFFKNKHLNYLL